MTPVQPERVHSRESACNRIVIQPVADIDAALRRYTRTPARGQKNFALGLRHSGFLGDDDCLKVILDFQLPQFANLLLRGTVRNDPEGEIAKRVERRQHVVEKLPVCPIMGFVKLENGRTLRRRHRLIGTCKKVAHPPPVLLLDGYESGEKGAGVLLAKEPPFTARFRNRGATRKKIGVGVEHRANGDRFGIALIDQSAVDVEEDKHKLYTDRLSP